MDQPNNPANKTNHSPLSPRRGGTGGRGRGGDDVASASFSHFASLCARSETCAADIRPKLLRRGLSPDEADDIIERLRAEGYIDDQRYANAFASDRFRFARWGRVKIRYALLQKHIPAEAITHALDQIPEEEYHQALTDFLAAKRPTIKAATPREQSQKLARAAIARGFEAELVFDLV